MPSPVFHFKQFSVHQDKCTMKIGTDGVLIGAWADTSGVKKILDIGTGTGVIAMMLAQKSSAKIDAIDIDESSCIQAKENISSSKFIERITVFHQSLQNFSQESKSKYDLIVSNPPYFHKSLKSPNATKNIARHSDFSELNSEKIIKSVLKLLNPKGKFCLILPITEGQEFILKAKKENLFCTKITRVFPKPGKYCIRLLMQFERKKKQLFESILTIETGIIPNDFTAEYKSFSKDFYLAF